MSNYKNCNIRYDPQPHPGVKFTWSHEDFDGPEDDRCGYGISLDDCMTQIDNFDFEDDGDIFERERAMGMFDIVKTFREHG